MAPLHLPPLFPTNIDLWVHRLRLSSSKRPSDRPFP
ncbi:hypothetical protein LINPERPRIM_LOCUS11183 [Linum perenne]